MARYNTSLASATINGTSTISSPNSGAFTALTGSAPYTVTLPAPALFPGNNQTFYNATAGIITLSTPSGAFNGTGGSGAGTVPVYAGNVVSITSDGTNYIVISEDGSAMTATTGNFSSNVTVSGILTVQASGGVSLAPSSAGNIDNVAIGASARSSGAFTTLAANGQVSLTANTASTSTSTGSLVVTGGIGVSGSVYTGGTVSATNLTATNVTGTLQTAAQPNITSTGGLTAPQLVLAPSPVNQIATIRRSAVSGSNGVRIQGNAADGYPTDANAGAYIQLGGGAIGDTYEGNVDIVAFGGNVDGNRNQIRFSNRSGANATTERMRIDKDGNVGIGTQIPGNDMPWGVPTLDVSGSRGALVLRTTNSAGIATLRMTGPDTSANDNWHINMSAGVNSTLNFSPKAGGGAIGLVLKNDGFIGAGIYTPLAKLHVVASTPTGLGTLPGSTTAVLDSSSSNYLTFRNTADNATQSGLLMQDNNVGGYLVFRNYDASNAAISDRMFLAGYQGVNIQYGTADNADVTARTTAASFDSTGIFWEKRKLIYSQDIAAPTNFVANTWFRFANFEFNGTLDTDVQPGWLVKIYFGNLNPSYGYIHWVTAIIPPLSSNTYTGYQGGYNSSHYGNTSVANSLVFNSSHHTSAGANHDIRLKLDSSSSYGAMNLFIWSNTGNSSTYPLQLRIWKL